MSTAKRKAYAVTIVAGLLALVGERLFRSGATDTPAPASASERSSNTAVPAAAVRPGHTPDVEPAGFPKVPAELELRFAGSPRDPFAIEKPVRRLLGSMEGDADGGAGNAAQHSAEAFVSGHKLSAVMRAGDVAIAVVDGELVRPGQTVDGWTLQQIQGSVAVFQCGDKTTRLTMEIGSETGGRR